MNIKEGLEYIKELKENNLTIEEVVNKLSENNYYHIVAVNLIKISFDLSIEDSRKVIYANKNYSKYSNEKNPFNENFNELIK